MDEITHISVGPGDGDDPEDPPKAVYVQPPAPDVLEAKPFASGRHRLERMPGGEDAEAPVTLWSWTEGDG
jgi:hypothetical protein